MGFGFCPGFVGNFFVLKVKRQVRQDREGDARDWDYYERLSAGTCAEIPAWLARSPLKISKIAGDVRGSSVDVCCGEVGILFQGRRLARSLG